MSKPLFLTAALASLACATPCMAQSSETPGVTQIAPGVQEVDGSKVPSLNLDASALETTITASKHFSDVRKLLGGNGVTAVGPQGSTVHMYKVHDTGTGKDLVVILFVKEDAILTHLIR